MIILYPNPGLYQIPCPPCEGVRTPRVHRTGTLHAAVGYLNNSLRKRSAFEALVNTLPWWRFLEQGTVLILAGCEPLGQLIWRQRDTICNKQACQEGKIARDMAQPRKMTHMQIVDLFGLPTGSKLAEKVCGTTPVHAPRGHRACTASDTPLVCCVWAIFPPVFHAKFPIFSCK